MGNIIIEVEHLSKAYRIGLEEKKSDTMAGAAWQALKVPIRNLHTLRNLNRSTGDDETLFWALKDISFDVKEGAVLGIIGHNGAGKSTLLKILSRITEPTEGRIKIQGRVASLLEVGTGFHPDLTGRENIYMNGTILGMRKKEIDAKLDEIISFSGISKHIDTPVKRFSSGMAVRLAFSVAAHLEPEILIIDEVLAVGDAEFQKKCLSKMESVASNGRIIIFVSHNMHAIRELCDHGILLSRGEKIDSGPVDDVVNRYLEKTKAEEKIIQKSDYIDILDSILNLGAGVESGGRIEFKIRIRNNALVEQIVNIDYAVSDLEDNYAIHSRSPWVAASIRLKPENIHEITYRINENFLGPGSYNFVVYIYDVSTVHLYVKNLCPFTVSAKNNYQKSVYLDGTKSSYIPPFEIAVKDV